MADALGQAGPGIEARVSAAETIIERIAGLTSAMQQDLYLKDLSERSGIDLQLLKQKLAGVERKNSGPQGRYRSESPLRSDYSEPPPMGDAYRQLEPPTAVPEMPQAAVWSRAEEVLLCLLIHNSEARQKIAATGVNEYFYS